MLACICTISQSFAPLTKKETDKLNSKSLDQWPTFAATIKKITSEQRDKLYQCQVVKKLSDAQSYYQNHFKEYCSQVTECLRSRLKWYDMQLMRDIIFVLRTQGWEKAVEEDDSTDAINRIVERGSLFLCKVLLPTLKS